MGETHSYRIQVCCTILPILDMDEQSKITVMSLNVGGLRNKEKLARVFQYGGKGHIYRNGLTKVAAGQLILFRNSENQWRRIGYHKS